MIEQAGGLVAIEVKATANPGLKRHRPPQSGLLEAYGARARHGVLLHAGAQTMKLAERSWAVPLSALVK
ncbi:MAG: hypothetical protein JNK82_13005 [Myxococcaceae bacterium]|nr:hypothetical protein [Myxococcaceae bacterium]